MSKYFDHSPETNASGAHRTTRTIAILVSDIGLRIWACLSSLVILYYGFLLFAMLCGIFYKFVATELVLLILAANIWICSWLRKKIRTILSPAKDNEYLSQT